MSGFLSKEKKFGSPVWRTHRGEQRFALAQTLPYHFVAARRDRAAQISLDGLHNAVVRPGVCHPSPEPRPLPRYGRAGLLLVTTSLRRSVLAGPSPHNLPQGWYWWRSGYPSLARHRWCEALPALPLGVCECEWNVSASLLRIHKQPPLPVSLPPGQSSVKKKKIKNWTTSRAPRGCPPAAPTGRDPGGVPLATPRTRKRARQSRARGTRREVRALPTALSHAQRMAAPARTVAPRRPPAKRAPGPSVLTARAQPPPCAPAAARRRKAASRFPPCRGCC